MIAIIDYGVGNLFSLRSSFAAIGESAVVTSDERVIASAERLILPGVGAFGDAAELLHSTGLDEVVKSECEKGKPLMGICLGMQLLFTEGLEYGSHRGLDLIGGVVRPIAERIEPGLKIPHIGWNALEIKRPDPILKYVSEGDCVYFVHSFFADTEPEFISSTAEYGGTLTASVRRDNIWGCQFHPEKSGRVGLNILKAFSEVQA